MRSFPASRILRGSLSSYVRWLALLPFIFFCTGCFSHRGYSVWSNPNHPAGQCAILPVLPAQVRITLDAPIADDSYEISTGSSNVRNKEEVARIINEVLDTIADSGNNGLQGPEKIGSELKRSRNWDNLEVYLQDPGPANEPWKRKGLAEIYRELGYPRILRVRPTLRFKPNLSLRPWENDPMGLHWDGKITLAVEMLDLKNAKVIAIGTGEAGFHGNVGVAIIGGYGGAVLIPYAFGKAFDLAVDQAARKALTRLFGLPPKEGSAQ